MAGEWISVDCCLPSKPEALMIMAATGQPPDVVVGRLTIFWGWVQLNAVDGVINGTPDVLALVAGGDAAFWLAVEKAGWLTFSDDGKVRISGWEERFSQAAKERLKDKRRKADGRKADKLRTQSGQLPDKNQTTDGLEEKRREERRKEITLSPSSNGATTKGADDGDEDLRILEGKSRQAGWAINAWQEFLGGPWKAAGKRAAVPNPQTQMRPPEGWVELADDAFQLAELERAAGMLSECRYFEEPVGVVHFLRIWRKILDGESYRKPRVSRVPGGQPERAPLKAFSGADADRFEATRRRLAEGSK